MEKMSKILFKSAFTLIVVSISICLAAEKKINNLKDSPLNEYPVFGIDISHHQKNVNWDKVKNEGVQFAFLKATEGGSFKDKQFLINVENAKKANIDIGAYHYFTFCKSAEEQFANFSESIDSITMNFPPVIDLEFIGNCKLSVPEDTIRARIDALSTMLENKYGRKPVYYSTYDFINHFYSNEKIENPIWIKDISGKPRLMNGNEIVFWQFTNEGVIDGITGNVDINVFWGNSEDYMQFKIKR